MHERARLGLGTRVVPAGQGSTTIADVEDEDEDEVGVMQCGIAPAAMERGAETARRRGVLQQRVSASAVAGRHGVHTILLFRRRRRYRTPADSGAGLVTVEVQVEAPNPSCEARPDACRSCWATTCGSLSTRRCTAGRWRGCWRYGARRKTLQRSDHVCYGNRYN